MWTTVTKEGSRHMLTSSDRIVRDRFAPQTKKEAWVRLVCSLRAWQITETQTHSPC